MNNTSILKQCKHNYTMLTFVKNDLLIGPRCHICYLTVRHAYQVLTTVVHLQNTFLIEFWSFCDSINKASANY